MPITNQQDKYILQEGRKPENKKDKQEVDVLVHCALGPPGLNRVRILRWGLPRRSVNRKGWGG